MNRSEVRSLERRIEAIELITYPPITGPSPAEVTEPLRRDHKFVQAICRRVWLAGSGNATADQLAKLDAELESRRAEPMRCNSAVEQ